MENLFASKPILGEVSYLILDKTNKVVAERKTEQEAKDYVTERPYLRYETFEVADNTTECDLPL